MSAEQQIPPVLYTEGYLAALEATARWAEDVARPALEHALPMVRYAVTKDIATALETEMEILAALAVYPTKEVVPQ